MTESVNHKGIIYVSLGVIIAVSTSVTTSSTILSFLISILLHLWILLLLYRHRYVETFIYMLLFMATTVELDTFIFGDGFKILRYSFTDPPILHGYLLFIEITILFVGISKNYRNNKNELLIWLTNFIYLLYVTGIISSAIGYALNDNNIISGPYPKAIFQEILNFTQRFLIITIAIKILGRKDNIILISQVCIEILMVVVISSLITSYVFGITGFYADFVIMVTPLAIALTPFLICFYFKKASIMNLIALLLGLSIILATFTFPTPIGSKWYLIIIAAMFECIALKCGFKNLGMVLGIGITAIFILISNSDILLSLIGNEFVVWKLSQSLNLLNVFNHSDSGGWYAGLDHSTLYRIDELHNTLIEYTKKPIYALFGKGFAGTTQHYTTILAWESDSGAFPLSQIKIGAYYGMHESFAVLFLRHGLMGIVFAFIIIKNLITRICKTPWAIPALIWFVFYWGYGMSLIIGSVMLVLAFSYENENSQNMNKQIT